MINKSGLWPVFILTKEGLKIKRKRAIIKIINSLTIFYVLVFKVLAFVRCV